MNHQTSSGKPAISPFKEKVSVQRNPRNIRTFNEKVSIQNYLHFTSMNVFMCTESMIGDNKLSSTVS